ncbi:hypothetical protein HDV00_001439 [Rhizophlyctis rosea]|nr:hypothetical protein HDV00_001439 [Rhizophlyctis rosea]
MSALGNGDTSTHDSYEPDAPHHHSELSYTTSDFTPISEMETEEDDSEQSEGREEEGKAPADERETDDHSSQNETSNQPAVKLAIKHFTTSAPTSSHPTSEDEHEPPRNEENDSDENNPPHPTRTPHPQRRLNPPEPHNTKPNEPEADNSSDNIVHITPRPPNPNATTTTTTAITTPTFQKRKRSPGSGRASKRFKRSSDDPDAVQEARRQLFEDYGENVEVALVEEMMDFYDDFPELAGEYAVVNKIGEGTFSSVYKAVDLKHSSYDNSAWLNTGFALRAPHGKGPPFVAIKRIYVTSSPTRIYNELDILHRLSGHPNIIPIITAKRRADQVIAILPYFEHEDFRAYYLTLSLLQIRQYMRTLLSALAHVHEHHIIHRDVKPSNFLYDPEAGTGVLVDFGLAQEEPPPSKKDAGKARGPAAKQISLEKAGKVGGKRAGYVVNDPRPGVRANRAGTRGFRAPEVLFKVSHQTCAIDVWSAGVILLSLFSGHFPFFQSNEDSEALLEIAHIFGKEAMQKAAASFKRTFETNIPDVGEAIPFDVLCRKLYPKLAKDVPKEGWDLLSRLLTLTPEERIGAAEALEHEFLRDVT